MEKLDIDGVEFIKEDGDVDDYPVWFGRLDEDLDLVMRNPEDLEEEIQIENGQLDSFVILSLEAEEKLLHYLMGRALTRGELEEDEVITGSAG